VFFIGPGKSQSRTLSKYGIAFISTLVLTFFLAALSSISGQEPNQKVLELFNAGQDAHQHGDLKEAVKLYSQAIDLDSSIYQIHYQLGIALISLKRPGDAIKSFENVVRLKPDFAKGLNALGEAQFELTDLTGAVDSFSKALQIDPSSAKTHTNLAAVLIKQASESGTGGTDLLKKAKSELETAMTLGDKSSRAPSLLAAVYAKTGDRDAAIKMLDQVIAAEPSNMEARLARGHLQFESGNMAGAIADLETVYKTSPTPDLAAKLSDAYIKTNRVADALNVLADSVHRNPQNEALFNSYVSMMVQTGHGDEVVSVVQHFSPSTKAIHLRWSRWAIS